jgi:hypothetical protein
MHFSTGRSVSVNAEEAEKLAGYFVTSHGDALNPEQRQAPALDSAYKREQPLQT